LWRDSSLGPVALPVPSGSALAANHLDEAKEHEDAVGGSTSRLSRTAPIRRDGEARLVGSGIVGGTATEE
jgi:hypothetical protein